MPSTLPTHPSTKRLDARVSGSELFPDQIVEQRFDERFPNLGSYRAAIAAELSSQGEDALEAGDSQLVEAGFYYKVGIVDCSYQIVDDRYDTLDPVERYPDGEFDE